MLQLPRRPWLEETDVRTGFQHAGARCHPDGKAGSEEQFAKATEAYQTLREPASRLRHLLALEAPAAAPAFAGATGMPAELIALFPKMARVREVIDRWNQRRQIAPSALQRALLDHELSTIRREANEASEELMQAMNAAMDDLRKADGEWPSAGALQVLPALQSRFAFLQKWQAQLREALLRLEIGEV